MRLAIALLCAGMACAQSLPLGGIPVATGGGGSDPGFVCYAKNETATGASTSIATSTTCPITAGNLIVVADGHGTASSATSVTCGSDSLSLVKHSSTSDPYAYDLWSGTATNTQTTVCTANYASANYRVVQAAVYSGGPFTFEQGSCSYATCDNTGVNGTARTATDLTTTHAKVLLVYVAQEWNSAKNITQVSPWTLRSPASSTILILADRVVTATGTYPSGNVATTSASDSYAGFLAAFYY